MGCSQSRSCVTLFTQADTSAIEPGCAPRFRRVTLLRLWSWGIVVTIVALALMVPDTAAFTAVLVINVVLSSLYLASGYAFVFALRRMDHLASYVVRMRCGGYFCGDAVAWCRFVCVGGSRASSFPSVC